MQEHDKGEFRQLMLGIGEVYSKEITKPLLRIYFDALAPLSIKQASEAITKHVTSGDKSSSFFPKPGDLIRQLNGNPEQQLEDKALIAWATIESEISRIGSYGTLDMEDKQALGAVRSMGGWKQLCLCTTAELVWKKKEFIDAYACYERTPLEALPSKLAGRLDIELHKKESEQGMKNLVGGMKNFKARISDSSPKLTVDEQHSATARDLLENQDRNYIKNWLAEIADMDYRNCMRKKLNEIKNADRG